MNLTYNRNGHPTKKSIKRILEINHINPEHVTFSAEYMTGRSASILWTRKDLKDQMMNFHEVLEIYGIKIKAFKYTGRVHSIYFQKKNKENH
jgi:hypothetical protein